MLQSVSDRIILGGEASEVADLGWVHRPAAEDDPHAHLRILVTELVSLAERAAPIWRVTQQAAAEEPCSRCRGHTAIGWPGPAGGARGEPAAGFNRRVPRSVRPTVE
ncbi:hypothetical protein ABLE92_01710 [Gordonia sp. VNQ95]|uniref:hypothetical protein n=1 Tax=Gordonia sp. VNQ95 TaxID=3156619 RepID=UPI0032B5A9D7